MNIIIVVCWFLIFVKLLFFWLWLWQLKEYHLGRFKAHFETQAVRKILSSFWRIKYPRFTPKIIIIFLSCLAAEILLLLHFPFPSAVILTFFLIPLFVLSFQIPSALWRQVIINRAKKKRAKFKNLLVIGITGSYGKTSTKEFLAEILSSGFRVLKTKEHQNSEIGISQCLLNDLKKEHEVFVVEMAAYNKGGIKLLCDIVRPKIGIITGVNEQHLATFGAMENLLSAEGGRELIESLSGSQSKVVLRGLPIEGMVFLNGKNELCRKIYQGIKIKKYLYGEKTELLLENIEGAKAVAKELAMSEEEIAKACQGIENKFPGIEIKRGIDGLTIIDATYSANPTGLMAHLDYLKTFPGKKVIVMPCLIELGEASGRIHKEIGEKIKEVCHLAIITTKDRFKEIAEGALLRQDYGGRETKILLLENPKKIFEKIKNFCQKEDVVLLEGRISKEIISALIMNSTTD